MDYNKLLIGFALFVVGIVTVFRATRTAPIYWYNRFKTIVGAIVVIIIGLVFMFKASWH